METVKSVRFHPIHRRDGPEGREGEGGVARRIGRHRAPLHAMPPDASWPPSPAFDIVLLDGAGSEAISNRFV